MDKKTTHNVYDLEYLLLISLAAFILCLSASCSNVITGKVTAQNKDTVTLNHYYKFKVYDTTGLYVGKYLSFKKTVNRSKINSKRTN